MAAYFMFQSKSFPISVAMYGRGPIGNQLRQNINLCCFYKLNVVSWSLLLNGNVTGYSRVNPVYSHLFSIGLSTHGSTFCKLFSVFIKAVNIKAPP